MVYYYEKNGEIKFVRDERPDAALIIEKERQIPVPKNRKGYERRLNADFESGHVWYTFEKRPPALKEMKAEKIAAIQAYDSSEAVNRFYLNDTPMWLDKATRVGLMNSVALEQAAGKEESTLWYNAVSYTFPIELMNQMLSDLELYALESYHVTQRHIAAVLTLECVEEVDEYDLTANYPEVLTFTT